MLNSLKLYSLTGDTKSFRNTIINIALQKGMSLKDVWRDELYFRIAIHECVSACCVYDNYDIMCVIFEIVIGDDYLDTTDICNWIRYCLCHTKMPALALIEKHILTKCPRHDNEEVRLYILTASANAKNTLAMDWVFRIFSTKLMEDTDIQRTFVKFLFIKNNAELMEYAFKYVPANLVRGDDYCIGKRDECPISYAVYLKHIA